MKKNRKKMAGFSIMELLVVIAVIGIIVGISVTSFRYLNRKINFNLAVWQVANSIREAQIKSRSAEEDSPWGVYVENNKVTIFKGENFSERNASYDRIKKIYEVKNVSGTNPFIFNKISGFPQNPGTITLLSELNSHSIKINEKGSLEY